MSQHDYTYIYGIWFIPGEDRDFLGQLAIVDGVWRFDYRFWYYKGSDDPFDGTDEIRRWSARMRDATEASKQKAIASIEGINPTIEAELGGKCDFVLLDCKAGDPKIFFELASRPWAHVKRGEPE